MFYFLKDDSWNKNTSGKTIMIYILVHWMLKTEITALTLQQLNCARVGDAIYVMLYDATKSSSKFTTLRFSASNNIIS